MQVLRYHISVSIFFIVVCDVISGISCKGVEWYFGTYEKSANTMAANTLLNMYHYLVRVVYEEGITTSVPVNDRKLLS